MPHALVGQGEPRRLDGAALTFELFRVLGARPALGRVFDAADDQAGAPRALLLGFGLWQGQFGGDPAVLGRKVILDDAPYEVVGVMPRDFRFPSREAEFWSAERFVEQDFADRTNTYLGVVARLRPGVSLPQARAEMRLVAGQLEHAYPKENARIGAAPAGQRRKGSGIATAQRERHSTPVADPLSLGVALSAAAMVECGS